MKNQKNQEISAFVASLQSSGATKPKGESFFSILHTTHADKLQTGKTQLRIPEKPKQNKFALRSNRNTHFTSSKKHDEEIHQFRPRDTNSVAFVVGSRKTESTQELHQGTRSNHKTAKPVKSNRIEEKVHDKESRDHVQAERSFEHSGTSVQAKHRNFNVDTTCVKHLQVKACALAKKHRLDVKQLENLRLSQRQQVAVSIAERKHCLDATGPGSNAIAESSCRKTQYILENFIALRSNEVYVFVLADQRIKH